MWRGEERGARTCSEECVDVSQALVLGREPGNEASVDEAPIQ